MMKHGTTLQHLAIYLEKWHLVLCILPIFLFFKRGILTKLTSPSPQTTLARQRQYLWVLAAAGVRTVAKPAKNNPSPSGHFPPYLWVKIPPGIWVRTYPQKKEPEGCGIYFQNVRFFAFLQIRCMSDHT